MTEEEFITFTRGKIVAIAQAILDEEIGIIAGSRKLSDYGSRLYTVETERLDEEYFVSFERIDSETCHLPVDWERKNWSEEALGRKDSEIADFEAKAKNEVFAACKALIDRYEEPSPA